MRWAQQCSASGSRRALCLAVLLASRLAFATETSSPAPDPLLPSKIAAATGGTFLLGGAALWAIGSLQLQSALLADGQRNETRYVAGLHNQLGGVALVALGLCGVGVSIVTWRWSAPGTQMTIAGRGNGFVLSGSFP